MILKYGPEKTFTSESKPKHREVADRRSFPGMILTRLDWTIEMKYRILDFKVKTFQKNCSKGWRFYSRRVTKITSRRSGHFTIVQYVRCNICEREVIMKQFKE